MGPDSCTSKSKCLRGIEMGVLPGRHYSGNLTGKGIHTNQTYMRQTTASDVSFFIHMQQEVYYSDQ